jgi:small-conductance mechanosensitive channel/CRP-like cAMP-binding protein
MMEGVSATPVALYFEIFFVFVFTVLAVLLYFLGRLFIRRVLRPRGKSAGILMSRLNVPLAFLIVFLILKIEVIRKALFPTQKFYPYFDAAVVFFFIVFLIRLIDGLLRGWHEQRRREFPLPKVLHSLILALLYLAVFFIVLRGLLGINITPFLATSAILTMILGLAFQGVLSNILAGMSLHLTKSFHKSDWVRVGDTEGIVIDTNWRETRIFDRFSNIVVLPNNVMASEKIVNFSQPDKKTALTVEVKASSSSPPAEVIAALCEAAVEIPEVLNAPTPEAYLVKYDDLGISYTLKFWIANFNRKNPIMTDVGRLIWYKFSHRGIQIPAPVAGLVDEASRFFQAQEGISAVDALRKRNFQDLMKSSFLRYQEGEKKDELIVPEEEIGELAGAVRRHRYTRGEIVARQGDRGESCFVLASGKIKGEIVTTEKGKEYKNEFTVESGGIFGEMSLFTGMPRTATGIVTEESEMLEIGVEDFAKILERHPQMADVIAGLVSARNKKNQEFLKKIKELSARDIEISTNKHSILERLKGFIRRF